MFQSFPNAHHVGYELLYGSLAEAYLFKGEKQNALHVLYCATKKLAPQENVPNVDINTAFTHFKQELNDLLQSIQLHSAANVYSTEMEIFLANLFNYSLLECLDKDMEQAGENICKIINSIEQNTLLAELAHETLCRVVFLTTKTAHSFKPAVVREVLEIALAKYPNNSLFLSMYGWSEGRSKLDNKVRRFINQMLTSNPTHQLWLFAIWTELQQRASPNKQVIRSLFEQCFESPRFFIFNQAGKLCKCTCLP
jgi:hypothetical protein